MLFPGDLPSYLLKLPAMNPQSSEMLQRIPRNNYASLLDNYQEILSLKRIFLFPHPRKFFSSQEIMEDLYALMQILLHFLNLMYGACTSLCIKCIEPSGWRLLTSRSLLYNLECLSMVLSERQLSTRQTMSAISSLYLNPLLKEKTLHL